MNKPSMSARRKPDPEQRSPAEARDVMDGMLRRMLNTAPDPRVAKPKPKRAKKRAK